jgi:acetyltransferase-like isoleucine patch superfamily enzyme
MESLKSLAESARFNDKAQQGLIMAFFSALSRVFSESGIVRHADGGELVLACPLRVMGKGQIVLRGRVHLGVWRSPFLLAGAYLEARTPDSRIFIDDGAFINNNACIVSEGASINIGQRCLIGTNFWCVDSNFHDLDPQRRARPDPKPLPVVIEDGVFIGEGVKILKGVHIGRGSVIAAGAVLFPGFACPPGSTVGGNPARILSSDKPGPR